MKAYILTYLLLFTVLFSYAQPDGNEWIDYDQLYFRINVYEDGVCRLYHDELSAALPSNISINDLDPRSFQIFGRGEELYIHVEGENDGNFNTNDYIEFYAEKNNGWFDSYLYEYDEEQTNPNHSLFTDTASYFFTWNSLINNKRMTVDSSTDFSGYTPLPFCYKTSRVDYTNQYYPGNASNYQVDKSRYVTGEGWMSGRFGLGETITKEIPTKSAYLSGNPPDSKIEIRVFGASNFYIYNPNHHLVVNFMGETIDTQYRGYILNTFQRTLSTLELGSINTSFSFSTIDDYPSDNDNVDHNAIAYISIKYPHTFDMEGNSSIKLSIPNASGSKTLMSFTNLSVGSGYDAWMYDQTNHNRVRLDYSNGSYKGFISNSGNEKECYLFAENTIQKLPAPTPVTANSTNYAKFTQYIANTSADYIIITQDKLMTAAEEYKDYRNTTGNITLLADIDQLYDQYSYGIKKHPLSIKNFIKHCIKEFNQAPEHLFLIGKAYSARYYRSTPTYVSGTLVPAWGNPPSDIYLTSGILDNLYQPAIPTGRLAAQTPEDVYNYLNKVKEHEAQYLNPGLWMKDILHFCGSDNFCYYLNKYKDIIEDTLFGGYVRTFQKTSSSPIQINTSDSLRIIINNGVSMITFFGHGSAEGFDISLDNPEKWENQGKYPIVSANSCYSGDIFSGGSASEKFVLIPDKGAIAFLASSNLSLAGKLDIFSSELYKNISYKNYGGSIAKSVQQTIKNIQQTSTEDVCATMILHGDPAISFHSHNAPDYEITSSDISFTPHEISTETDSFNVDVTIKNLGTAVNKNITLKLTRELPESDNTENYLQTVTGPYYISTFSFTLPVDFVHALGLNNFIIEVDYHDDVKESDETNNRASIQFFIKSADVIPVNPPEFAIIPNNKTTLMASTGNPFSSSNNYIFELDTCDKFTTPLESHTLSHSGGILSWTPTTTFICSTVYYWRVCLNKNAIRDSNDWRMSSFQYITGKTGWGQAHYYQFRDDNYRYVKYNEPGLDWIFTNDIVTISAQTLNTYPTSEPAAHVWYKINGETHSWWSGCSNALKFVVIDPINGKPWEAIVTEWINGCPISQYKSLVNHTNYAELVFDFSTSGDCSLSAEEWRINMRKFLDTIPIGYKVLTYSHKNTYAENYEEELYQALERVGCVSIRDLDNGRPYICCGTKSETPIPGEEVIATSNNQLINLECNMTTRWTDGYIATELIGPASKWDTLYWRSKDKETPSGDILTLDVYGIKSTGDSVLIISKYPSDSADIYLPNYMDAETYPYLVMQANMEDDTNHTPAQMIRWQVLFDGVPETCIDPSISFNFYNDTIDEGDNISLRTAIHNISSYNMDSLLVNYQVLNSRNTEQKSQQKRLAPHPAGDTIIDTYSFNTRGLSGLNSVWMEVNPAHDQAEQHHFNNIGQTFFYVVKDKTNPLLDVTFDGIHILDGDIVSGKPEIQIMLKDENKYLALNDTGSFRVFLKRPSQTEETNGTQIFFNESGDEPMIFTEANLPNNSCKISYSPILDEDGIYQLMIQANDISNNESGDIDYTISFEVINESTITEIMNYPNPFTSSTRFVFTLTGSELPTKFRIQIMTITGKVVRDIGLDELGAIHIGRNITQYAWNGTDNYGDQLGNGIYLYRVITRINGEDIKKNQTSASKFFVEGFGKMCLIR